MNGTQRMAKAMKLEKPDRVPLMCQPSWSFVLKQLPWLNPVARFKTGTPVSIAATTCPAQVRKDAIWRLETGMKSEGFILSTACSIAPGTPAQNLDVLIGVVEKYGYY